VRRAETETATIHHYVQMVDLLNNLCPSSRRTMCGTRPTGDDHHLNLQPVDEVREVVDGRGTLTFSDALTVLSKQI
jgi:hypothetical protein